MPQNNQIGHIPSLRLRKKRLDKIRTATHQVMVSLACLDLSKITLEAMERVARCHSLLNMEWNTPSVQNIFTKSNIARCKNDASLLCAMLCAILEGAVAGHVLFEPYLTNSDFGLTAFIFGKENVGAVSVFLVAVGIILTGQKLQPIAGRSVFLRDDSPVYHPNLNYPKCTLMLPFSDIPKTDVTMNHLKTIAGANAVTAAETRASDVRFFEALAAMVKNNLFSDSGLDVAVAEYQPCGLCYKQCLSVTLTGEQDPYLIATVLEAIAQIFTSKRVIAYEVYARDLIKV